MRWCTTSTAWPPGDEQRPKTAGGRQRLDGARPRRPEPNLDRHEYGRRRRPQTSLTVAGFRQVRPARQSRTPARRRRAVAGSLHEQRNHPALRHVPARSPQPTHPDDAIRHPRGNHLHHRRGCALSPRAGRASGFHEHRSLGFRAIGCDAGARVGGHSAGAAAREAAAR